MQDNRYEYYLKPHTREEDPAQNIEHDWWHGGTKAALSNSELIFLLPWSCPPAVDNDWLAVEDVVEKIGRLECDWSLRLQDELLQHHLKWWVVQHWSRCHHQEQLRPLSPWLWRFHLDTLGCSRTLWWDKDVYIPFVLLDGWDFGLQINLGIGSHKTCRNPI